MEWVKTIAQYGIIIVAIIALIGDRLKRKDTVVDKDAAKADRYDALNLKVDRYKVDTDEKILHLRNDMNEMDERFQQIFTNLDNKLDDSLRHVAKGNALLKAQSVNSIAYRAGRMITAQSAAGDEYRNLLREYQRVKDLVGVETDPDIVYLDGLMKKVERLKIK